MTTTTTDGNGTPRVTSTGGPLSSSTGCTAGYSPTPARDIDRRASKFIDRVHHGMLAGAGGEQDR
uniref:Uncharacterized protein n=1 Tax=Oryza rufipogon TaxID=4529 RepID=A0A0E0MUI5_ORYRU